MRSVLRTTYHYYSAAFSHGEAAEMLGMQYTQRIHSLKRGSHVGWTSPLLHACVTESSSLVWKARTAGRGVCFICKRKRAYPSCGIKQGALKRCWIPEAKSCRDCLELAIAKQLNPDSAALIMAFYGGGTNHGPQPANLNAQFLQKRSCKPRNRRYFR